MYLLFPYWGNFACGRLLPVSLAIVTCGFLYRNEKAVSVNFFTDVVYCSVLLPLFVSSPAGSESASIAAPTNSMIQNLLQSNSDQSLLLLALCFFSLVLPPTSTES